MVNWNAEQLKSEAVNFAVKHGYPVPKEIVLSDRMNKSFGQADLRNRIIKLNRRFVELNNEDVVRALIVHEIVHLKYGNHGDGFAVDMRMHGYGKHLEDSGLEIVVEKHVYICGVCGEEYESAIELGVEEYRCKKCKGDVRYDGIKVVSL